MSAISLADVQGIPCFDCSETAGIAARWKRWKRAFELFATGKGVTDAEQKKALLLHTAGMDVQDIFFTLPGEAGEDDDFVKATKMLDKYFTPQSNVPYERHVFRSLSQQDKENVEQFVTRLRQQAETCEFGDANAVNEQLRDQVIEKCSSHHLRRKLLEKGRTLTLAQVKDIARAMEESERQASAMEGVKTDLNKLTVREKPSKNGKFENQAGKKLFTCYACGQEGHIARDPKCPAKGQKCKKCHGFGHFGRVCKTKTPYQKSRGPRTSGRGGTASKIRQVHAEEEYVFSINEDQDQTQLSVDIGGVDVPMIIDPGASCNCD